MARDYGNLGDMLGEPLPPDVQAAEDRRIAEFVAGLPDVEGVFSGHLVTDACYRLGGCGPDCPPGIRVDAAKLDGLLGEECPACGDTYHDLPGHLTLNYKGCADQPHGAE